MSKPIMKSAELCVRALDIAKNYNTVYMWGTFGHRVTETLITQKTSQYPNYYTAANVRRFRSKKNPLCWAFDCVGLIKGILWGWSGDSTKNRGGVVYPTASQMKNGAVPDTSADGMISKCSTVSTDFSTIQAGEAVWIKGHIGIYVGGGLVVEATDRWNRAVMVTRVAGMPTTRTDIKYSRTWTKHGKLPWVDYAEEKEVDSMKYYETVNEVPAGEMRDVVSKLVQRGTIKGTGGSLHLSEDNVRLLVYLNREGLFK